MYRLKISKPSEKPQSLHLPFQKEFTQFAAEMYWMYHMKFHIQALITKNCLLTLELRYKLINSEIGANRYSFRLI